MLAPSIAGVPWLSKTIRYLGNGLGDAGRPTSQESAD